MYTAFVALGSLGILVTCITAEPTGDDVTTTIGDGEVRGTASDVDGVTIETYHGIPYARPPTGDLRFREPLAPIPWKDTLDASVPGSICVQIQDPGSEDPSPQSEDCLFINVYAPSQSSGAGPYPVMVWVHGGGYRFGQGAMYDGRRLAAQGIVVVTFNYRLDALGFLSTDDEAMPGNYGMLDQVAALDWVRDNIADFGGDPERVTLAGQSAGSGCVSFLLLSPLAEGLFHGAIMESGVSLAPGAWEQPTRTFSHREAAAMIGEQVGCTSTDSTELRECFRGVSAPRLVNASNHIRLTVNYGNALMTPRVEQTHGFLPDIPSRLLTSGDFHHVNTIRGYNEHEFALFMNFVERSQTSSADTFKNQVVQGILSQFKLPNRGELVEGIADDYLDNIADEPAAYAQAEVAFGTDYTFSAPLANEIELASKAADGEKHYLYKYSVRPQNSQQPDWVTAVHADEVASVFGLGLDVADTVHKQSMEAVMATWANFIKTGDPNGPDGEVSPDVTWAPFSADEQNMVEITEGGFVSSQYDDQAVTRAYAEFLELSDTTDTTVTSDTTVFSDVTG